MKKNSIFFIYFIFMTTYAYASQTPKTIAITAPPSANISAAVSTEHVDQLRQQPARHQAIILNPQSIHSHKNDDDNEYDIIDDDLLPGPSFDTVKAAAEAQREISLWQQFTQQTTQIYSNLERKISNCDLLRQQSVLTNSSFFLNSTNNPTPSPSPQRELTKSEARETPYSHSDSLSQSFFAPSDMSRSTFSEEALTSASPTPHSFERFHNEHHCSSLDIMTKLTPLLSPKQVAHGDHWALQLLFSKIIANEQSNRKELLKKEHDRRAKITTQFEYFDADFFMHRETCTRQNIIQEANNEKAHKIQQLWAPMYLKLRVAEDLHRQSILQEESYAIIEITADPQYIPPNNSVTPFDTASSCSSASTPKSIENNEFVMMTQEINDYELEHSATIIQAAARGHLARQKYKNIQNNQTSDL